MTIITIIIATILVIVLTLGYSHIKILKSLREIEKMAKDAKSKNDLMVVRSELSIIAKKCWETSHYSKMSIIRAIVDTKEQYIK